MDNNYVVFSGEVRKNYMKLTCKNAIIINGESDLVYIMHDSCDIKNIDRKEKIIALTSSKYLTFKYGDLPPNYNELLVEYCTNYDFIRQTTDCNEYLVLRGSKIRIKCDYNKWDELLEYNMGSKYNLSFNDLVHILNAKYAKYLK